MFLLLGGFNLLYASAVRSVMPPDCGFRIYIHGAKSNPCAAACRRIPYFGGPDRMV